MAHDDGLLDAAQSGDGGAFESLVAPYLRELRAHCYRMAGSLHEADDLMQESLLKAWKGLPKFERRSDLRTWLYKVITNVCLDELDKRGARVLPMELGNDPGATDPLWIEPCPADVYRSSEPSPADCYESRQSVALAFLVAIQLLPARQRAALLLRDVLGFQATECAELLDLSVAAVNSALQRARATLAARQGSSRTVSPTMDDSALLERYVREQSDVGALVSLLLRDATLAMPPLPQWVAGAAAIGASIQDMLFGPAGPGVFRLVRTEANGQPAFGAYKLDRASGEALAMSLHVLELSNGGVASITAFLNPSLLAAFGLPDRFDL
jgi:RNA polymerase sigma-70 factor (ECF subfamily)